MRFSSLLALTFMILLAGCAGPSGDFGAGPGIHAGKAATFRAQHNFTVDIPAGAQDVEIWFATPHPGDRMQDVADWKVNSPHPTSFVTDEHGNRFLHMHLTSPEAGSFDVETSFHVKRSEVKAELSSAKTRPHTEKELQSLASYLRGSQQSVIDDNARAMARRAVGSEKNPVLASRKIYDAILEHVEYHVKDPRPNASKIMNSTGKGSSQLCYTSATGNCTDFHSLYAAVSRAAGIPTRTVYGSFFKGPLDGKQKDQSYHCWIEFHAPNIGWIPLDVAVADIFVPHSYNEHSRPRAHLTVANGYEKPDPAMVDYYFGNIDERRVTWHWNRDLKLGQKGGPLLWNPKAYAEVNGKPAGIVKRTLTYTEVR